MKLELISFQAADKITLPGLLYSPDSTTTKVAIWLHGMGDNGAFYNPGRLNELGEALANKGIALLAFNNRGAHNSKTLNIADEALPEEDRRYKGGTHYEKISDCVYDIDGAVTMLRSRGFEDFYLAGHSSGANKICVYDTLSTNNPFSKYVLAAPGDDVGGIYSALGKDLYISSFAAAQEMIAAGEEYSVMPESSGMYPFSARAAADIMDPNGPYNSFPFYEATTERLGNKPLFNEYRAITKPLLVIFGENDEYAETAGGAFAALSILADQANPAITEQSSFVGIPNTDHGFHGAEEVLANIVAEWLS